MIKLRFISGALLCLVSGVIGIATSLVLTSKGKVVDVYVKALKTKNERHNTKYLYATRFFAWLLYIPTSTLIQVIPIIVIVKLLLTFKALNISMIISLGFIFMRLPQTYIGYTFQVYHLLLIIHQNLNCISDNCHLSLETAVEIYPSTLLTGIPITTEISPCK